MLAYKYPVALQNLYGVSVYSNERKLKTCGEQWVDEGRMTGSFLIDSSGAMFRVNGVRKLKSLNPFPNWLVPYDRRIVLVDYELGYIENLCANQMKRMFIDLYKNIDHIHQGIEEELESALSIAEIFEIVGVD